MKKSIISIFLLAVTALSLIGPPAHAAPTNSATSAILIEARTGKVLFSQNADQHMLIASTTKIMTALVVLKHCAPDDKVEIKPEYTNVEGSSIYLKAGEAYTVEELLYGLLLASGNDAAVALACHCAGSIEDFAKMMNEEAASLGLSNSSFKNPNGLDAEGHYSSAADLAVITAEALKNELFATIVSTKTYTSGNHSYINHNKLLWQYDGCKGVKTGYTMAAGRSLVSCAERGGLELICVTLSDPNDWSDHAALYDWAFSQYEYKDVLPQNRWKIPVISGTLDCVGVEAGTPTCMLVSREAKLSYRLDLPQFVYAGIRKGDVAGRVFVYADGEEIGEYPLVYAEDVPLADDSRMTAWQRIRKVWYLTNKYGFVLGGATGD